MCEGDDEKGIGGMVPSIKKKDVSEEDFEGKIPASSSLPMNIDADEDYLHYIKELERRREPSPLRSSQASVPDSPKGASNQQSDGHNASSYDPFGVWQAPSSSPNSYCTSL
ncbi:hypothetical protein PIB30_023858, partial [Stylosanthes scabra]|nr:hypothetical protein [Stylosanthes scabra]